MRLREKIIRQAAERADNYPHDGLNCDGEFVQSIAERQREFIDGFRCGALMAANIVDPKH